MQWGKPAPGGQLGTDPVFAFTNEIGRIDFLDIAVTPVSFLNSQGSCVECLALGSDLPGSVSPSLGDLEKAKEPGPNSLNKC